MRYRLLTLLILMAVMPPVLATAWINRDYLLGRRSDLVNYIPAGLTRGSEAKARRQLASVRTLNYISGIAAMVLYPVVVLLQWKVLSKWRDWTRPPKQTPLAWVGLGVALLLAIFALTFFLTLAVPLRFDALDFTSPHEYERWKSGL